MYRQAMNGNHAQILANMKETYGNMTQEQAIEAGLAENENDTKWKTDLQLGIDQLTAYGAKVDALYSKYEMDGDPSYKQQTQYHVESFMALQETKLTRLQTQLNNNKNQLDEYIKANDIQDNEQSFVRSYLETQKT